MLFNLLIIWAINIGFARAAASTQFRNWYPQYGSIFRNITLKNCSAEYLRYLAGDKNLTQVDYQNGGDEYTVFTQPLIDCILNHTSEFLKGGMTSAQVLLGVMPTVLALLGPSHDEIAMLANVGRRPLLAAGLALACPSTYFSRAFEYSDPQDIMSRHENRRGQWRPKHRGVQLVVSFIEYGLTAAACFNVVKNTREVNVRSISSLASDADYLPGLWLGLGMATHLYSGLNIFPRIRGIILMEFFPCAAAQYEVQIATSTESKIFLFTAWWESTFTVLQVVFGTLVFSSTLFVGTKDALGIVGRYIGGVAVCRVILMYELAGLRENCTIIDGKGVKKDEIVMQTGTFIQKGRLGPGDRTQHC
ncbi:hypothetical protein B0T10DRAFT_419025 [Thelonectria olida]|uniref:Uncharacterized protein n=1 Tax=Thelonectria olida TaxID=1576542 RepID=A0A9P8VQ09_9HYPO|nr:hypothetical protein B0T10DRAFT_419025 [Thelonectria olida]